MSFLHGAVFSSALALAASCAHEPTTMGSPTMMAKTDTQAETQRPPSSSLETGSATDPDPLLRYDTVSEIGTLSTTTVLSRRLDPTGVAVATLSIQGSTDTTLMDIAFDCAARTYRYLHIQTGFSSVSASDVTRVQKLSSGELASLSTRRRLQPVDFMELDTIHPDDMDDHLRLMSIACEVMK